MRVLLSEGSSLTAREHLSVLGPSGVEVDVAASTPLAIARFSRWCRRIVQVPRSGEDPVGYLDAVATALRSERYDALLPTHEQAWLFAAGRHLLPDDAPLAVSAVEAFDRIQSKLACCRLFDDVGLAQPAWTLLTSPADVATLPLPCWLKAPFSTAGRGVRNVRTPAEAVAAFAELSSSEGVLAQQPVTGRYAQVGALFEHGRLVAVHTSEQAGVGAGGSAAARVSVDHPLARADVERLGRHLGWHGGLTLDYLHEDGSPCYIEANPRTVEPANAAAAGVDLPALTIALGRREPLPGTPVAGRPGVRTHSTLALMMGAAERTGSRAAVLRAASTGLTGRGPLRGSREVLTPPRADPLSLVPVGFVAARLLTAPSSARAIAAGAVSDYAVPPSAVEAVRR